MPSNHQKYGPNWGEPRGEGLGAQVEESLGVVAKGSPGKILATMQVFLRDRLNADKSFVQMNKNNR